MSHEKEKGDQTGVNLKANMLELANTYTTCYIGLGSNIGDSKAYLNNAIEAFQVHPFIKDVTVSNVYLSKPHGPKDQPDYFNAVVRLSTSLKPEALLDHLQFIEKTNHRVRKGVVRWGARTLDLDLLFYGDEVINTRRLTVPHPRICERSFVLLPLKDLAPHLKLTDKITITDCISKLPDSALNDIKEL